MLARGVGLIAAADLAVERSHSSFARSRLTFLAACEQPVLMAVLLSLIYALASIGLGAIARLVFIVAALVASIFYVRRSPWQYVTLTLWFWTLTPLARRLIDYQAGFDPVNLILATPNFMGLFMLKDVITSRDLLRQREATIGLFLLLPLLYGLGVNFVQGDVVPGAVGGADWVLPVFYYFYFIVNWRRIEEAEIIFRGFVSVNLVIMLSYGMFQFFNPLTWDVTWVINSGMTSIGRPEAYQLRVFGTLNSPGIYAYWILALILLSFHFRTRVSTLLVPAGVLVLLMTQVRAAQVSLVFGLLLAGMMGRRGTFKLLGAVVISTVLVLAATSVVDPDLTDVFLKRFSTMQDLGGDQSAQDRAALYEKTPSLIAESPFGRGVGGFGRGAIAATNYASVDVDSGPLAVFLSLGWIAGCIYFLGMALILIQGLTAARITRSSPALALSVTAMAGFSQVIFAGIAGFSAATLFICAAYAAAIGMAERKQIRHR